MSTTKQSISASDALKSLAIVLCALFFLTSCKVFAKDGLILMTDRSYKATVFATNKIGFGAPDGLCWYQGKLYLADEGAGALLLAYFALNIPMLGQEIAQVAASPATPPPTAPPASPAPRRPARSRAASPRC